TALTRPPLRVGHPLPQCGRGAKARLTLPLLRNGPLPLRPEGRRGAFERQEAGIDFMAQAGDGGGELVRAAGGFAEPERHVGRLALGILDADRAALDAPDAIGGIAKLKDLPGAA